MKGEIKCVKSIGNCNFCSNRRNNINSGMFSNSNGYTGINNNCSTDFFSNFNIHTNWFRD